MKKFKKIVKEILKENAAHKKSRDEIFVDAYKEVLKKYSELFTVLSK